MKPESNSIFGVLAIIVSSIATLFTISAQHHHFGWNWSAAYQAGFLAFGLFGLSLISPVVSFFRQERPLWPALISIILIVANAILLSKWI